MRGHAWTVPPSRQRPALADNSPPCGGMYQKSDDIQSQVMCGGLLPPPTVTAHNSRPPHRPRRHRAPAAVRPCSPDTVTRCDGVDSIASAHHTCPGRCL